MRLDNLVSIVHAESPSRIDRQDRQRQVNVRANVAPGFAQADRMEALQQAAEELNMPAAYTTAVAGRARELERTFREFLWAFLLSVIFMYMILAAQFESLVHPLTILLSLPLAVPFALFSLWATGPDAEPLLRARAAGAVRRREEERDPADRSHEQPAARRASSARRPSWRPTAIGCARS